MLEMAETASSGMMERLSEMSSEDGGSLKGSREKLLASPEVNTSLPPDTHKVVSGDRIYSSVDHDAWL